MSKYAQFSILALFHLLLLCTPLFFLFSTEELFEFNKMMLTYCITILICGAWLVKMIAEGRLIFKRTVFDIPLLLFLVSQVVSTVLSMHPRTSIFGYYSRFHGGLLSTISYLLLYYAFVSNVQRKQLASFGLSAFVAASVVSVYGILEHFGHSFSCYLITQGQSFGVDCWIQKVQDRVFATFGQPNWLAAYAITLLPLGITSSMTVLREKQSRLLSGFLAGVSVLLFLTLLYTQSRSGILGLVLGMGVLGLGLVRIYGRKLLRLRSQEPGLQLGLGTIIVMMLFAVLNGTSFTPALSTLWQEQEANTAPASEIESTSQPTNRLEVGGTDSGEIRKIVWEGAVKIWQRYPLFGSGVETFAYSYYLDRPVTHNLVSEWDFLYNKAHNEFLNFLATTGLFGFLAYTSILVWFFGKSGSAVFFSRNEDAHQRLISLGLLSGIVALTVSNFFGFSTVMVAILLFLYLAVWQVLYDQTTERVSNASAFRPSASNRSKKHARSKKDATPDMFVTSLLYGLVAIAVIIGLGKVSAYWSADKAYAKGKALLQVGYPKEGLNQLSTAIKKSPNEALYYDELAIQYANLAVQLATAEDATSASQFAQTAIVASDQALVLNPVHINFYKSRARVFITLAQLDESFLDDAKQAVEAGLERAPNDAKLLYTLGLIEVGRESTAQAISALERTIAAKPNHIDARLTLADQYIAQEKLDAAKNQYLYILEKIDPTQTRTRERLNNLEASISAKASE